MSMDDEMKDHLDSISDASYDLREMMRFDPDDWRSLPKEMQNAVNEAAMALEKLESALTYEEDAE